MPKDNYEEHMQNQYDDTGHVLDVSANPYNEEVAEYFINIKNDLNQIERLVNDAVTNLVINFKYIKELSKSHHEMVLTIEKLSIPKENKPVLELLQKQMVIADSIERELGYAMISLQFGDLVSQLLVHTTKQIEILNLALQRIDHQDIPSNFNINQIDTSSPIVRAIQQAKSKKLNKPVVQHAMQKGKIELF
ncbi:MAG: hypothetical protein H6940_10965 [Burkholderiales bacterium]|uniref:hypothetical protein n=1 Tax=Nitrosomonas sp. TaxID=42353 RepID=UPI001D98FC63|nr:hypothetical protein [Nitrosomonas sp.]MCB1950230.1 hypothetical protein [Nitrosomonas sp.]MCP5243930.1 hypothetical protein [Burkholderiales bacterium]